MSLFNRSAADRGGLARLYRPSPAEFFPKDTIVAKLDAERNIVFFRKDVYDSLDERGKSRILNLQDEYLELA